MRNINVEKAKKDFLKTIQRANPDWENILGHERVSSLRTFFNKTNNINAKWLICRVIKDIDPEHQTGDLVDEINTECEIQYYDLIENEHSTEDLWKLYHNIGTKNNLRDMVLKDIFNKSDKQKERWNCFRSSKTEETSLFFFEKLIEKYHENVLFLQLQEYPLPELQAIIVNTFIKKYGITELLRRSIQLFNTIEIENVFVVESYYTILLGTEKPNENLELAKQYISKRYKNSSVSTKEKGLLEKLYIEIAGETFPSEKSLELIIRDTEDIISLIKIGYQNKNKFKKTDDNLFNALFSKIIQYPFEEIPLELLKMLAKLYKYSHLYRSLERSTDILFLEKIKSCLTERLNKKDSKKHLRKYVRIIESEVLFTEIFRLEISKWKERIEEDSEKHEINVKEINSINKLFEYGKKKSISSEETEWFTAWFQKVNELGIDELETNRLFRLSEIIQQYIELAKGKYFLEYENSLILYFEKEINERIKVKQKKNFLKLLERNFILEPILHESIKKWKNEIQQSTA